MNKLKVLQEVKAAHRVTSKDLARALSLERDKAAWFLLRLYRQSLVSRELLDKSPGPGRRPYAYTITERGRDRIEYLASRVRAKLWESSS